MRPAFGSNALAVSDVHATSADGVQVPMTLIRKSDARGPQLTLLEAYGSYGISLLPEFAPRTIVLLQEGATTATCHVRGGGELGEPWRIGRQGRQQAEYVARSDRVRRGSRSRAA